MKVAGVLAAGTPPVFSSVLGHGVDPEKLTASLGFEWLRPLSVHGTVEDLVLTVLVRPGKAVRLRKRKKLIEPGLVIPPGYQPVERQRVAAYVILTSARGVLGALFSESTIVAGLWGFPGGGLEPGETPSQALLREVAEETGQPVAGLRLADAQSDHWIGRAPDGRIEDFHAVRIVYAGVCPDPTDPIVADVGGTTARAKWIPLADWPDFPWTPGARQLLRKHLPAAYTGRESG